MKKIATAIIVLCVLAPIAAFAQSSDDVILDLLTALDAPLVTATPVTTRASSTPAATPAPKKDTQTAPAQQILAPLHLFDVEGNSSKPDPTIEGLKATLASLVAQFAMLAASSTQHAVAASSGATTTAAIVPALNAFLRDLGVGSRGDDVRSLQKFLIERGFLYGDVTGYFGILTKTAVLAFQTDQGLPAVGNVGPRTRALLNAITTAATNETDTNTQTVTIPAAVPLITTSTSAAPTDASTTNATSTAGTSTAPVSGASKKPVTVSMSILPSEAPVGGSVSVTWLSQNANSCEASDGWGGSKPTIGAAIIEPLKFSLTLVLTCFGSGGVASTSAQVTVGGQ